MVGLSLSRAWDETKAVLGRDGRLFVAVALALFVLPGVILDITVPDAPAGQFPPAGPWMIIAVVAILISLIGQLAVIRLAMGPHLTVGQAIAHGGRRVLAYIAAVLLWSVPILLVASILFAIVDGGGTQAARGIGALALLLLGIFGIFIAVRLILASAVAGAEPISPSAILRRSWALTGGNWWRLFLFLVMFAIGALVLVVAVQSVTTLIARMLLGGTGPMTVGGLLVAIASQLVSAIVSVGFFVMVARIYAQLAGASDAQPSVPSSGT